MRNLLLAALLSTALLAAYGQKKPLTHDLYDSWRSVSQSIISDDGHTIIYGVTQQAGDDTLTIYNVGTRGKTVIPRGKSARFFGDSKWAAYLLHPSYDTVRKLEIAKTKPENMPKAEVRIIDLANGADSLVRGAENLTTAAKAPVVAFKYTLKAPAAPTPERREAMRRGGGPQRDTTARDTTRATPAPAPAATPAQTPAQTPAPARKRDTEVLVLVNVATYDTLLRVENADKFALTQDGEKIVYTIKEDSLTTLNVWQRGKWSEVARVGKGAFGKIELDKENSARFAYTMYEDTVRNKAYRLFDVAFNTLKVSEIPSPDPLLSISNDDPVGYSKTGGLLTFSLVDPPRPPVKDTLPASEKFTLDVWSFSDTLLISQQQVRRNDFTRNSRSAVHSLKEGFTRKLTHTLYESVMTPQNNDNARFYPIRDVSRTQWASAWDYPLAADYYLYYPREERRELVLEDQRDAFTVSPKARWVVYFDREANNWFGIDPQSGSRRNLTSFAGVNFTDETDDFAGEASSYDMAGWVIERGTKDPRERLIVYDRYDLWLVDPAGRTAPKRLTRGREEKRSYRVVRTNPSNDYLNEGSTLLLNVFDNNTKQRGFAALAIDRRGEFGARGPQLLAFGDWMFRFRAKAKDADRMIWTRESFAEFPDLRTSDMLMREEVRLTDVNPQMKDYKWGSAELVRWDDFKGNELEGILYKPENYDPTRRYPVIVYFYERSSHELFFHTRAVPSASTVVIPMYTSNDYVVFVPDIHFTIGDPGPSGYNCVVSGAQMLIDRGIADPARIALQGQSWGGYLVNYIITQTDMFCCASSGAGVSNMVSGYATVRDDSGSPRMMQYENGQSRIGATLWENTESYLRNSPIFFLPAVETPLLIRHSSNDNAVPFPQAMEMFNSLRRLGRRVWLLNYHGEGHNMRTWGARKDWSIRLQQFFDHYMKGEPMPRWMAEGRNLRERESDLKLDPAEAGGPERELRR